MAKDFMLEDPNISCMSPSQFVHERPINTQVLHWAFTQVLVAGAAVVLLPGAGHSQCPASCETGGNTQNAPKHRPIRRAPSTPSSDIFKKEQQLQAVGTRGRERRLRTCRAGDALLEGGTPRKDCTPRDWLQNDS